jgi:Rrf2 family transcriptional repressor of oqxAB
MLMLDFRFSTALQIMLSLALADEHGIANVTSSHLADGLGVSSSFVRSAIVPMVREGLIASSMGKFGGLRLGRPASAITLREIYNAGTREKRLWDVRSDVPSRCIVSANIESFFDGLSGGADELIGAWLSQQSLADALGSIRRIDRTQAPSECAPVTSISTARRAPALQASRRSPGREPARRNRARR